MTTEKKITILINQKPFHLENSLITAAEMREKVHAPDDYEVWQVVKSPDPEGQLPLDDIMITASVEVKSGDKFRVVPPGTFGATSTAPQQLLEEIAWLRENGSEVELLLDNNLFYLVIANYRLPTGYNKAQTKLLLKVPISYPNGSLDMFWADHDLRLESGRWQNATTQESTMGQQWLRFSWHPKSWNPGIDNLVTYIEFVDRRLSQLK